MKLNIDFKKCSKCGEIKPKTEFNKYKDGLQGYCKCCIREYSQLQNEKYKGTFIYCIYEGPKVVYVGSTNNLYKRINFHINSNSNLSKYINTNKWTSIRYIELDENMSNKQLRAIEQIFMNEFNPNLNKKNPYPSVIDSNLYDLGYEHLDEYQNNSILYKENYVKVA